MGKYKVVINDQNNIRDLLQETYKLCEEQLIQAQNEINKLASSTRLQDEIMDAKSKYAKSINDYLGIKDKAISKKIEIAKLLTEICKYNGDVNSALNEAENAGGFSLDFDKIKAIVDKTAEENNGSKKEIIHLKKD
jgi:hypothetical protein